MIPAPDTSCPRRAVLALAALALVPSCARNGKREEGESGADEAPGEFLDEHRLRFRAYEIPPE